MTTTHSPAVSPSATIMRPITTFAQRIEAARLISDVIAKGMLDNLGATAEIDAL